MQKLYTLIRESVVQGLFFFFSYIGNKKATRNTWQNRFSIKLYTSKGSTFIFRFHFLRLRLSHSDLAVFERHA